jgi:HPt (histidine-containing phosphotransfer) domain-containing protein
MQAARLFDFSTFSERLGGDIALERKLVNRFIAECPSMVASVREALENEDAGLLLGASRAIRGALLGISADGVAKTAAGLETAAAEARLDRCPEMLKTLESEAAQLVEELRHLG